MKLAAVTLLTVLAAGTALAADADKPMPIDNNARPNTATNQPSVPAPSNTPAAVTPGDNKVWINKKTKTYLCKGDKWYGNTKAGKYATEADAQAAGVKPAGGKACS